MQALSHNLFPSDVRVHLIRTHLHLRPRPGVNSVRFLTVYVNEPLIPYLSRKSPSARWKNAGPFAFPGGETVIVRFLARLCRWQRKTRARDCQIVSIVDVQAPFLAVISYKNYSARKIRHLVLSSSLRSTCENYLFPGDKDHINIIDSILYEFEVLEAPAKTSFNSLQDKSKNGVRQVAPRLDLYTNVLKDEARNIPVVYTIDVFLSAPLPQPLAVPGAEAKGPLGDTLFQDVVISYILQDIDKVQLTLGPVTLTLIRLSDSRLKSYYCLKYLLGYRVGNGNDSQNSV